MDFGLTEPEWMTDGTYAWTGVDYIYSLLLDNPTEFYITPDEQVVFIFLQGRGLVRILHDFKGWDDDKINHFIHHIVLRGR